MLWGDVMSWLLEIVLTLGGITLTINLFLLVRYYNGKRHIVEANNLLKINKLRLPQVEKLEILPLVDYETDSPELKTEAGLSYLVKAENEQILFDVGYNKKAEDLSPLLQNAIRLNIDLSQIEALAISHNHADHVGGINFKDNKVELSKGTLINFQEKPLFAPIELTCETTQSITVTEPTLLTKSIGSTGPIKVQLFMFGETNEQSLLINVKDKGVVLISGCGHPQIINMVKIAGEITDKKIYGVVGGLHLFKDKPNGGILAKIFGSDRLFSSKPSHTELKQIIVGLKALGVQKVFLSPHDTDKGAMQLFEQVYGDDFKRVFVGQKIQF